jgi:hypothetical protein
MEEVKTAFDEKKDIVNEILKTGAIPNIYIESGKVKEHLTVEVEYYDKKAWEYVYEILIMQDHFEFTLIIG